MGNYPARVEATKDRVAALQGADYVVITILASGVDVWQHDILIPKKYGIDTNIGDTRGPSGIFRALRTIPVMLDIAREMERYCPNAVMLNYTNPMAMLCRAMQRETSIELTGLCHSVQGAAEMLAGWIGAPMAEITYTCAGINHMAWYDAYVEVPVWASRKGLEAAPVGSLPPQCAMLTGISAQIEEMTVEAAISGNPRLVYQAIAHDPLTAAVLSLAEIKGMVDEMFEQNGPHLPQFGRGN
jgi:alpha-galactosidase/6-phospho-beta-glucosidase family protein